MSIARRRLAALVAVLPLTLLIAVAPATAAHAGTIGGPILMPLVQQDVSPPLASQDPQRDQNQGQHEQRKHGRVPGNRQGGRDAATPGTGSPSAAAPALGLGFEGIGNGSYGYRVTSAPPDTNGAVGPNHYVALVNQAFAIFNKSGSLLYGPANTNTLFNGFGGGCQTNNDGDGTVEYDKRANRFVITQFSVSTTPYLMCIAVSTTGDPTGTWNRYAFSGWGNDFPDYPKLSIWSDAYYLTVNAFLNGSTFDGPRFCALDRTRMVAGQAATMQCFNPGSNFGGDLASDVDGPSDPPAGSPAYIMDFGTNALDLFKFHVDFTTPANSTLTGPTSIPVASFSMPCNNTGGTCVPQSGTSQQLDTLGDRLMTRLAYRNFGDHESIVATHTVQNGSSSGGIRWYEIRSPGGTPTVFQQSTFAPDANFRWMPSIAMDGSGDIAVGYSESSSTMHPAIAYTGRAASDPAGTMQAETVMFQGAGSQTVNLSRWGDYSSMTVDPSDDCTFWYTSEYIPANGTFNWRTRIGSFKFPNCGAGDFSISANPNAVSVAQGGSGTSTISTAVTSGAAGTVSLTASGAPSGTTATLNPTSVTAGGSSTLTLNVGSSTAPGTYTITVTGSEGANTHSTTVSLTVTASDFSISASPSSVSAQQGSSATSTISTAVTSGVAQAVNLSASGLPAGASASFNPTSVTAGGSSTLTLTAGSSTPAGTYPVTVTGTGSSATHSTTVTFTVTQAPPSDFSISANPGSVSVAQGGGGTSTISTAVSSGAAQTVNLSASGAPSGTTATLNPASVTAGNSSTLTLNVGGSTAPGTYTITVTGTEGANSHSTTVSLTVTASDFSISASPSSLSLQQGSSGTSTISTAVTSGVAQSVSLSAAGVPAGAAATFNPTSVTAGASSTLTINSGTAATGTYTVTVTGTGSSATHSTAVSLTITAPPAGIVNGGFESGDFSGWTPAGTTAVVSGSAHGGTYAARVGGTSPTNGDSSIAQTFNAPAGGGSLTFWYQVVCPDTVTYDWATATLKDNTANTTSTLLGRTCTNTGAWVQSSAATLTGGHSYTVTLISHDDNYPGDPTYTLYDDVVIGAPPPPPPPSAIVNGGFEAGSLSGWTPAGTAAVVSGSAHSGTYAAQVGGTSPTAGDSSIGQTFTAPAGSTTLSFWYRVVCPDTVTYDWATATLKDNTTNTTTTVLSKTCTNTGAWAQKTAPITAGHSYTITLVSHDDNYAGDPTYTLYDDVATQ